MPRDHLQRVGRNLAPNPVFSGSGDWTLLLNAEYDGETSSTRDGSGAVKLPPSSSLLSKPIPLPRAGTYVLAARMRTERGPNYITTQFKRDDGTNYGNSGRVTTSEEGSWEEFVTTAELDPADSKHIRLHFNTAEYYDSDRGVVWVDEVFFAQAELGFLAGPSEKSAFQGTRVRVDALGNIETLDDGSWTPFFPIGMYTDGGRQDWSTYAKQGFNTNMWASVYDQVRKAQAAGMRSAIDLTGYMIAGHEHYNRESLLASRMRNMFAMRQHDAILWSYVDNEASWNEWDVAKRIIKVVHREDSLGGKRMHPVYFLQGAPNAARRFAQEGLSDLTGTYFGGSSAAGHHSFVILDCLTGQTNPASIAQFNGLEAAGDFRNYLYRALIVGAKGCGYWRDGGSQPDVTTRRWWPDIPHLSAEVKQLLPVIRTPHWTKWSATSSNKKVQVGSRELDGTAVLILVNSSSFPQRTTIRLSGLPYQPRRAVSFFDEEEVAELKDLEFTLRLPGSGIKSGTAVVSLEKIN